MGSGNCPPGIQKCVYHSPLQTKDNRQVCDTHRGIFLLCIAGKLHARIFLNRLIGHLEQGLLPGSQCGFRKERGTTDMIFAARQLHASCRKNAKPKMSTFTQHLSISPKHSTPLVATVSGRSCPHKFIQVVRQLHDGMQAQVLDDRESSTPFPVKRGCILAPTLFSMVFSAMLTDAS